MQQVARTPAVLVVARVIVCVSIVVGCKGNRDAPTTHGSGSTPTPTAAVAAPPDVAAMHGDASVTVTELGPCSATMTLAFYLRPNATAASVGKQYPARSRVETLAIEDPPTRRGLSTLVKLQVESDAAIGYAFVNPWELDPGCLDRAAVFRRDVDTASDRLREAIVPAPTDALTESAQLDNPMEVDVDGDGDADVVAQVGYSKHDPEPATVVFVKEAGGYRAHQVGYTGGGEDTRFYVELVRAGPATYVIASEIETCKNEGPDCERTEQLDIFRFRGGRPVRVAWGELVSASVTGRADQGLTIAGDTGKPIQLAWDEKRFLLVAR